jgi:thymidylate synthase ThyX
VSLSKEFFNRKTNITAKVVCDSISEQGKRITTFELEYPRFIHSEIMTQRELSKNCSSSRAIPFNKMVESIINNTGVPIHFGKNKSGMQASDEEVDAELATEYWLVARDAAIEQATKLGVDGIGLHKQLANRVTESFQMMKVVMTTTGLDNLLNLRLEKDAQPEYVMLAYKIYQAVSNSKPNILNKGQWHLPYVDFKYSNEFGFTYFDSKGDSLSLEYAIRLSVASCAAVSYRTEAMDMKKADKIFNMLINAEIVHASPFEHVAKPIITDNNSSTNITHITETWEEGITHMRRNGDLCSGNSVGWVQYRHLINHNTCHDFNYEERMKSFK